MNAAWPLDTAFLGAGGNNPRVDVLNADSGEIRKFIELPPMHSAYSIDVDWETGTLAVGTKGGLIFLIDSAQNRESDEPAVTRKLIQGAPVLSACWVSASLLAVSDTAGRCFLWHTNEELPPRPLEVMEGVICSLLAMTSGVLAGLSSGGKLIFWQPLEGQLVQAINVPTPPPMSALVRMVYWPTEHALVFPGSRGHATLYDLKKEEFRDLNAHEGPFYAISVWGESLLTVGMKDCRLKIWSSDSEKPASDIQVPEAVISVGVVGGLPAKILVVELRGRGETYTLEGGELRLIGRLRGNGYRVVAAPAAERLQALYAQKREDEVCQIVAQIDENVGRAPEDVIDRLHSRLVELRYKHVSLALRAEQAEKKGDIVEGLRLRISLMRMLPEDHPNTCPSMDRCAALLERVWQISEADAVCKRILGIDLNYPLNVHATGVSRISKLIKDRNWVMEPDIPIDRIIESATVIGKKFTGRYVIKTLDPDPCGWVKLTHEVIVEKYEQVRRKLGEEGLPSATAERVWWFWRTKDDEIELVTFGDGPTNDVEGLQFALKVLQNALYTVVVPVVLFNWRDVKTGHSMEKDNERASRALARIVKNDQSNFYLAAVHKVLGQALRRLVTERLSQKRI